MLEQALIAHGAPTLARMKPGSLMNIPCADRQALDAEMDRVNAKLKQRGVALTVLREQRGRALVYLYRAAELAQALRHQETRAFLSRRGYARTDVAAAILHLRRRLLLEDFPHEIGLFLGYPLADVQAFIQNEGRNCLCCGYWKVYSNVEDARRTFAKYRKCTEAYCRLFAAGCPLLKLTVQARPAS